MVVLCDVQFSCVRRHLQLDRGRDDHTFPQVSDSEHKGRTAVSRSDDGVSGEDERLCAPVGLCGLHEHTAEHHGVDDQAQDILDDQHGDGQRTLFRHHPATKTDGHLQQTGPQRSQLRKPQPTAPGSVNETNNSSHLDFNGEEEG